ncbi:LOW QUALITY PROTEIN: hypothetical protein SETIT_8G036200v2, partial [Setaria italica]
SSPNGGEGVARARGGPRACGGGLQGVRDGSPPRRRNAAVAPGESLRRCPRGGLPAREREDGPRRRPAQRRPPRRPPGRTAANPGEGPTAARKGSQGSWCRPAPGARSLALSRVVVILAFV